MVQENYTKVDGHNIRYLESGNSKNTLVLIHGLGASAERWNHVIPLFAKNYRVIIPDLIGFGYSDKPIADYTPKFFSEFLRKFLDGMDIKRPHIVGSSLGGQVTAEYAATNPKDLEKLILTKHELLFKEHNHTYGILLLALCATLNHDPFIIAHCMLSPLLQQ